MARDPLTVLEIDIDTCGRVFGQGACTASLGGVVVRKCYNTYATCKARAKFLPAKQTLRFCEARANLPIGGPVMFPALVSVGEIAATVNIAGADDRAGPLGRRASVDIELQDFAYHDRLTDPYQSQRISGAAQIDESGYDPAARGTFFARLRARWPYYAGRAARLVQGYINDAREFVPLATRAYVLTDWRGPDDGGAVRLKASDVFYLADTALAPSPSAGALRADITASAGSLTLTPAGIGAAEYPTSGRACIGSEIVTYTRAGDIVTLTARGVGATVPAEHAAGDTFQQVLRFSGARVDDVAETLLRDFAGVSPAVIPKSEWAAEVTRWLPHVKLTTDICQPVAVSQLLGELTVLGFSLFPNNAGDQIKLRANRPPDGDTVFNLTDHAHIKTMSVEDRQDRRLTEVVFFSVQIDPTKSATDISNYKRGMGTYDFDAKSANAYSDTRARRIFSRWFNSGNDAEIRIISRRLLNRFVTAPAQYRVTVDAKDFEIGLADLVMIQSAGVQDETGKAVARAVQVVARAETAAGHEIELTLQAYDFAGRYGFATDNARPNYSASSPAQRARGEYAAPASLTFPDGSGPYKAI